MPAKILFCDDERYRFEELVETGHLPSETQFESNILRCFELLQNPNLFEEIWLDHDFLNQTRYYGSPYYTGSDLAGWLVKLKFRGEVKIHSMNEEGAKEMADLLKKGEVRFTLVNLKELLGDKLIWFDSQTG